VCYIALNLAHAVELPEAERRAVFYAALLHDAGAVPATAEVCRLLGLGEEALFGAEAGLSPEQIAFQVAPRSTERVVKALRAHVQHGAKVAEALGFDATVREAIVAHHERWDGKGYPRGLKGPDIPLAAQLVGAADLIESLIASDGHPLVARRNLLSALAQHAASALEGELAAHALRLARSDAFWLGLHHASLQRELMAACPDRNGDERSPADALTFARVFAGLADAKGEHTAEHSSRTAAIVDELAEALGFSEGRREMLRIAATAHDVGLLGVPARTIAKPDILTLAEMEAMRKHPSFSQLVLEALPDLEEIARWVGAHHERPDGKGYPEMLEDEMIPLEARIIAVADTYVALTSPRPYREALSDEDARQVLEGGAGSQLDKKLVKLLASRPARATSSRTARRSRRTR
jgi:HD-GYP domain-containing protein (c-di-GMP phosphodiesterase class II)